MLDLDPKVGDSTNLLLKKLVEASQAIANGGGGGGAVDSVNGQTGVVVLTPPDIGAVEEAPIDGSAYARENGAWVVTGGVSYIDGQVDVYADLPITVGVPPLESVFLVLNPSGAWLINRHPAGLYIRTGNAGALTDWTYADAFPDVFNDENFQIYDGADPTKTLMFQLSGISAGTTRTLTAPDASGTIALVGAAPTAHAASHENGGSDEINVAGLSGVLADPQLPIIGATSTTAVAGDDARLTNARTPTAHAATHVNGTDDIQNATAGQKGLATAAQITKLDGVEAGADVTDAANVAAAGALMTASLGTGVGAALAVNIGSAGAPVLFNGEGGTPTSLTLTNATGLPTAGLLNEAVTLAKMANLAQDQFIGRVTASTGIPETTTITAAARTVLDDATVAAMATTLGLGTGDSPQFTAINVGNSSDTTLGRAAAGQIAVEGNNVFTATKSTANELDAAYFAADAGASDAYAANLSPAIGAYVTGNHYRFKANTANTGAATLALNGLSAVTIKKAAGGITTDLATNDIRAGQWVDVVYDGTNFQMQSLLGNAAAGGGGLGYCIMMGSTAGNLASGGVTYYAGICGTGWSSSAGVRRVYIPQAGTITAVALNMYADGTAGSAESWTCYLRLNNTTDITIASVATAGPNRLFLNTALATAVSAGDYLEIKVITPTWVTSPTLQFATCAVYIA